MTARPCPECIGGKHRNCTGESWDTDLDDYTACPCHVCAVEDEAVLEDDRRTEDDCE